MNGNVFDQNVTINISGSENIVVDVKKCLSVIFSTRKGTQALDRDFGLDWEFLDMPLEAAQASCTAGLITAAAKYEPRAKIRRVSYSSDENGLLKPIVEVEVRNE